MRSVFFLLLFFGLVGCAAKPGVVEFEEINVERINIVSPDGTHRLVIANKDRFPPPVLDGVVLDLPRSVVPAGMVFYDEAGNERGGIGVMEVPGRGEQAGMIFDYQNSEAVGIGRYESADGETYIASIQINDRIPLGSDIMEVGTAAPPRIHLTNINGRAAIELNDSEGKTRIRLFVNPDGTSGIEMLDDEGKVVSNLLNPADK